MTPLALGECIILSMADLEKQIKNETVAEIKVQAYEANESPESVFYFYRVCQPIFRYVKIAFLSLLLSLHMH